MVDKPRQVAALGGVDDVVPVDPEQIGASDALSLIGHLPLIGHRLPHVLTDVLNHHLIGGDRLQREQAPVVDGRLAELELLLPELRQAGRLHQWQLYTAD